MNTNRDHIVGSGCAMNPTSCQQDSVNNLRCLCKEKGELGSTPFWELTKAKVGEENAEQRLFQCFPKDRYGPYGRQSQVRDVLGPPEPAEGLERSLKN